MDKDKWRNKLEKKDIIYTIDDEVITCNVYTLSNFIDNIRKKDRKEILNIIKSSEDGGYWFVGPEEVKQLIKECYK